MRPTLLGTFRREFAVATFGILAQQTDPAEHILSQFRQFTEAVGLGKDGIGIRIIHLFIEVVGTWTAIMIDIERFLACWRWGILGHLIKRTSIEQARRTVDVGFQFLGYLRLRL